MERERKVVQGKVNSVFKILTRNIAIEMMKRYTETLNIKSLFPKPVVKSVAVVIVAREKRIPMRLIREMILSKYS